MIDKLGKILPFRRLNQNSKKKRGNNEQNPQNNEHKHTPSHPYAEPNKTQINTEEILKMIEFINKQDFYITRNLALRYEESKKEIGLYQGQDKFVHRMEVKQIKALFDELKHGITAVTKGSHLDITC